MTTRLVYVAAVAPDDSNREETEAIAACLREHGEIVLRWTDEQVSGRIEPPFRMRDLIERHVTHAILVTTLQSTAVGSIKATIESQASAVNVLCLHGETVPPLPLALTMFCRVCAYRSLDDIRRYLGTYFHPRPKGGPSLSRS